MNLREWALPVYTILIQLASGSLFFLWIIRSVNPQKNSPEELDQISSNPVFVIFLTIVVAMAGSHFHLSKPYFSFLAFLNIHTSWLSREIVFTVLFFMAVGVLSYLQSGQGNHFRLTKFLGWFAILISFANIYCMAMVYIIPMQETWNTPFTILSFYETVFLLGSTALATLLILDLKYVGIKEADEFNVRIPIIQKVLPWLSVIAVAIAAFDIITYFYQISLLSNGNVAAQTSLKLLLEFYWALIGMRLILMVVGIGWLAISANMLRKERKTVNEIVVPVYLSCLLVMIAEILGRFLFYASHVRSGL